MNKNNISLIWDLDGTLIDSYGVIVYGVSSICKEYKIEITDLEIKKDIIKYSVDHFLKELENKYSIPFGESKKIYTEITNANKCKIQPMNHSIELMEELKEYDIPNYVYTHKGASTEFVLKNTHLYDYFKDIVTSEAGFKRKPEPDAINYLVQKHNLDKMFTYYVGDRTLDIECACNAKINSILYLPNDGLTIPTGKETYIAPDLLDIIKILDLK